MTSIKTITAVATQLPPSIAILLTGPTGIGKSHVGKAIARDLGIPYIDVRGANMTEGDAAGFPDLETASKKGVACFVPPSWLKRACDEPVVLGLDELNRAMQQVMAAFFQLVLDREMINGPDGMPLRLHPETRVIAMINVGNEYDVNELDPALLRRFAVFAIEASVPDWLDWAVKNGISTVTRNFIRDNQVHFRVDPSTVEPGTVCPNPASWHRLDEALRYMDMAPDKLAGDRVPALFHPVAASMVGPEAAIAYADYIRTADIIVKAEEVLADFEAVRGRVDVVDAGRTLALCDRIVEYLVEDPNRIGPKAPAESNKNFKAFFDHLTGEQRTVFFRSIVVASNESKRKGCQRLLVNVHSLVGAAFLADYHKAEKIARDNHS